jgi:decaprenylphospho-beta-D-erythro-pentofuranosid-2-ulose 2-reductase
MTAHIAIFGATSAIAAATARIYADQGARLYLVGRNAEKLHALAAELGGAVVGVAVQDFDDTAAAASCVQRAAAALGKLDVALIAHGLIGDQRRSEQEIAEAEQIARTNYLSVIALLIPLANLLEAQRSGHLVVFSTVAAERGRPRNFTYAAAKSALNVYLQGLRSRLYPANVQVHTIKLGPVDTPMTVTHKKNLLFSDTATVAREIVRAVERGEQEAYVPRYWRGIMFVVRNLPELVFQRIGALSER